MTTAVTVSQNTGCAQSARSYLATTIAMASGS